MTLAQLNTAATTTLTTARHLVVAAVVIVVVVLACWSCIRGRVAILDVVALLLRCMVVVVLSSFLLW